MNRNRKNYPEQPIVLVDDEENILFSFETILHFNGMSNVIPCADSRELIKILRKNGASLVLLDLTMPHIPGDKLLPDIVQEFPEIPIIVVTGINSTEKAVECMKNGAYDFLVKPVEKERLLTTVEKALIFRELQEENLSLKNYFLSSKPKKTAVFSDIITQNPQMTNIFLYIEAVSRTSHTVLITGETGTGKELIAQAVYKAGGSQGEFVALNVAGLDDNIFADTLFGHVKGAYTSADSTRAGLIERAADGTLFLDEIGDLSNSSQLKLLRLLQEKEYFQLGTDVPKKSNARIIVATNQDLDRLQDEGIFRKDLYFRLCTHRIHLPPLRERLDDLPLLVQHFLTESAKSLDKKVPSISGDLLPLLSSYHFPGNIRELMALMNDAVLRHQSGLLSLQTIQDAIHKDVQDIPLPPPKSGVGVSFGEQLPSLKNIQKILIQEAMQRANGNRTRAAALLGTSRQTLSWHLKK